jgi:hypothetical protein
MLLTIRGRPAGGSNRQTAPDAASVCLSKPAAWAPTDSLSHLSHTLRTDRYTLLSIATEAGMSGWWRAPKTPTVASRAGLEPARRSNSRILTVVTSCRLSGVMAMHVPRAKHAPARSRPCLGGHALSTRPGAAAVKVRRWARHSVRCWSHATEGSQTRHVAGSRSQQRLLRASASFTDASRSSCRWPRPQWHWVRRDVGHMVWRRAHAVDALRRASRRPRAGRGSGRRRPRSRPRPPGRPAAPRDSATRTRPEMPQVSGQGGGNERTPGVCALRAFTWAPRVRGQLLPTTPTPCTRPACTSRS